MENPLQQLTIVASSHLGSFESYPDLWLHPLETSICEVSRHKRKFYFPSDCSQPELFAAALLNLSVWRCWQFRPYNIGTLPQGFEERHCQCLHQMYSQIHLQMSPSGFHCVPNL